MPVVASSLSPAVSFHRSYDEISTVHNNAFEHTVLYIEELRLQLYSCFTCGVSWLQDQVCLDCRECGGYALQRPCVQCDGRCQAQWTRDLTMTHACGKARWSGTCELSNVDGVPSTLPVKEDEERVSNSSTNLKLRS